MSRALRVGLAAVLAAGAMGGWIAVDAAVAPQGSGLHRAFGIGLGLAVALPALLACCGGRLRRLARGLAISAIATLAAVLVVEAVFRAFGLGSHGPARFVADPVLGLTGVPGSGDLDAEGFRNAAIVARPDVVVLGDSNTYGFGVARDEAIPQQLAVATGWRIRGLAHGDYGPLQYRALAERAVVCEEPPAALAIILYLGNDVLDAHRYLALDHWARLRDGAVPPPRRPPVPSDAPAPNLGMALVDWTRDHSRFLGWAGDVLASRVRQSEVLAARADREPGAPRYEGDAVATLFSPELRSTCVDRSRPGVRNGLRVTGACLEEIAQIGRDAGVPIVLALLPTKESVYAAWFAQRGEQMAESLAALAALEADLANDVETAARAAGLQVVDLEATLVACLARGEAIYWATADGHLAPLGCARVAAVLADVLAPFVR